MNTKIHSTQEHTKAAIIALEKQALELWNGVSTESKTWLRLNRVLIVTLRKLRASNEKL